MIKRPICIGAVFLAVVLIGSNFFGVSNTIPPSIPDPGGKQQVLGRVAAREKTAGGMRLYLEEITFLADSETETGENAVSGQKEASQTESEKISEYISNTKSADNSNIRKKQRQKGRLLVYLREEAESSIGSWLVAEGKCFLPEKATNPGQFNAAGYYQARNVFFLMRDGKIIRQWKGKYQYRDFLARLRDRLRISLERSLGREDAALIAAIALGERGVLGGQVKRLYQEGGIAHILAISSLHVTLLGMGLYRILRRLRCSLGGSCLLSAVFLIGFCIMTGMSVSAMRACIMFLLWLGSQAAGRTSDQLTSAALAALVILLPSPEYLWDSGFLLSFGCILSLQYLTPLVKRLLPLPGGIGKALQASLALQLGTMPLVMYFFYQITPYAFLVNLAVLPFMQVLMISGLLGSLCGIFWVPLGILLAAPCHYLLRWFELLCKMERQLPGAVLITGRPALWQMAVYYGSLIGLCGALEWLRKKKENGPSHFGEAFLNWSEKRFRLGARMGGIVLVAAAVGILHLRFPPRLRITFLDVGQGDGILIQAKNFVCMIDGGSSSVEEIWQYRLESTLKYYGISHLDAWFLSHGDYDHVSGAEEFLESYEANFLGNNMGSITLERLVFPDIGYREEALDKLKLLAQEKGIATGVLSAGGSFCGGGLELTCLYPERLHSTGEANQDSMVLYLSCGDFTALFTGDLEKEGEWRFLEQWRKRVKQKAVGELSLLKVAHHGSKNGTSQEFLEITRPRMAVISCGENNRYGHPAGEVLERLERGGTEVLRTDQNGAVIVTK